MSASFFAHIEENLAPEKRTLDCREAFVYRERVEWIRHLPVKSNTRELGAVCKK